VGTTNGGKKRMEFVNPDFNASINIRRCAVLEKRFEELTGASFVWQPSMVELYGMKLKPVVGGRSRETVRLRQFS